ncbi:hypothetical protein M408DRAFT_332168 [Serendipita vermifera MAFF 305830]|uniref:RraA-like protein n=1 Tax=Serendipita vermifera MAFF 305830 TaxID=933852 RepID=A0A0C2X2W4_SERVB|nr:hypothetical protein M408DRAFT_332168 [Serendipita vermifera MAFF 305830]
MDDYSTCEISDALIKLGSKHGGHLPDIYCISPGAAGTNRTPSSDAGPGIRIEGPAYTVKMVLFDDETAPKPTTHFVDGAKDGHIIVIDAPPVKSAVWGGLMSYGARARGAKGVVISGRCRDVVEHEEAGFPVFARGQSTLGQKPFTRPSALDIPLKIVCSDDEWPAVLVRPGDWIVADVDGVVVVPVEMMEQVRNACKRSREVDELCKTAIQAGNGVAATFAKYR